MADDRIFRDFGPCLHRDASCTLRRQAEGLTAMSGFKKGDRVIVLRLDSDEIECHGCYEGALGPIMFVLPDDDDLPDPVEVGEDRVFPEKSHHW